MEHTCIKPSCGKLYKDKDPDDYYCPECNEKRKVIAAELDTKFRTTRMEVKSDLQAFDELQKQRGVKFINIKDLGITI